MVFCWFSRSVIVGGYYVWNRSGSGRLHENARRVVFDWKKAVDRCGTVERKHSLLE